MAEKRMLHRKITKNKKLASLWEHPWAIILYMFMIPYQDDHFYFTGDIEEIKATLFFRYKNITEETILENLKRLATIKLITGHIDTKGNVYVRLIGSDDVQTFRPDRKKIRVYGKHGDEQMSLSMYDPNSEETHSKDTLDIPRYDAGMPKGSEVKEGRKEDKDTILQKLVNYYKIRKGFKAEDKDWDRLNFPRFAKSGKRIIKYLNNDIDLCRVAIDEIGKYCKKEDLEWTLETVVKRLADWKLSWDKKKRDIKKIEESQKRVQEIIKKEENREPTAEELKGSEEFLKKFNARKKSEHK